VRTADDWRLKELQEMEAAAADGAAAGAGAASETSAQQEPSAQLQPLPQLGHVQPRAPKPRLGLAPPQLQAGQLQAGQLQAGQLQAGQLQAGQQHDYQYEYLGRAQEGGGGGGAYLVPGAAQHAGGVDSLVLGTAALSVSDAQPAYSSAQMVDVLPGQQLVPGRPRQGPGMLHHHHHHQPPPPPPRMARHPHQHHAALQHVPMQLQQHVPMQLQHYTQDLAGGLQQQHLPLHLQQMPAAHSQPGHLQLQPPPPPLMLSGHQQQQAPQQQPLYHTQQPLALQQQQQQQQQQLYVMLQDGQLVQLAQQQHQPLAYYTVAPQ
jgi:hypothetical protein